MATKQQVIDLNMKHPDWTAGQLARELKCREEYIGSCKRRYGLVFAKATRQSHLNNPTTIVSLGNAARAAGLTVEALQQIGRERRA